jgi:magnesium chelatase subunit H
MLQLVASLVQKREDLMLQDLPPLQVTPDIGLIHPLLMNDKGEESSSSRPRRHRFHFPYDQQPQYMESPAEYLKWRLSPAFQELALQQGFPMARPTTTTTMSPASGGGTTLLRDPPKVALLLFRKHVITQQRYILDLITIMESQGLIPIPIFINGVEAHTIVRDWLTSTPEQQKAKKTKQGSSDDLMVAVDAIVNTIGFPLVGGPAGSMEAGRNVAVAQELLESINVPYIVAAPLLLQSIRQWKTNGVLGLQSVVLYSLPELDGAIDSVVLGGLVATGGGGSGGGSDHIALIPERVRKLCGRLDGWIRLRQTPPKERKIAIALYGFPPQVGAVGTAALLDVPHSLDKLLDRLVQEGYDLGEWGKEGGGQTSSGESLVAALAVLSENSVISTGVDGMQAALEAKMERARQGDSTVAGTLALPDGGGLGGAKVRGRNMSWDELEKMLGKYMTKKIRRVWSEKDRGPGVSSKGDFVVAGLQLGNVWIFVQPLLGVEGDPMRLLFERDLTPHPQYTATYQWLRHSEEQGGFGAQSMIHFGMHGTVEWLPGQPLGNDRPSWSDELLGSVPNLYIYAANNPSESILAKRRGYGTLVSYNVPPYGRSGLYLELANLKELVEEFRTTAINAADDAPLDVDVFQMIYDLAERNGMTKDVPFYSDLNDPSTIVESTSNNGPPSFSAQNLSKEAAERWVLSLSEYLNVLQDRLFSSGLHVFGSCPTGDEMVSYLEAYFGDRLSPEYCRNVVNKFLETSNKAAEAESEPHFWSGMLSFFHGLFEEKKEEIPPESDEDVLIEEASSIVRLLARSTEEIDSVVQGLSGGYIRPAPGGDLLRDGPSVLPTGRNIHALDPYRMPSASAWIRGQKAAKEILRQHQKGNGGKYPETVAVTLWGLDGNFEICIVDC